MKLNRQVSISQPQLKADLHQKKLMVGIWLSVEGVIHWEMLERNKTINSKLYCQQLHRVPDAIAKKRGESNKIIFIHDNARLHVSNFTHENTSAVEMGSFAAPTLLTRPRPNGLSFILGAQHFINGKCFETDEELKAAVGSFFDSKPKEFYKKGIHDLPRRCREIFTINGDYIIN